jgi:hypothetical protein
LVAQQLSSRVMAMAVEEDVVDGVDISGGGCAAAGVRAGGVDARRVDVGRLSEASSHAACVGAADEQASTPYALLVCVRGAVRQEGCEAWPCLSASERTAGVMLQY